MKPFVYCPSCATRLEESPDQEGKSCPSCGRHWYRNSAPTVGAVIVRDDQALVTKRGREPEKGRYDVPGGFLAAGEEALDGLRRELKEELGVEVDVSFADFVQIATHTYGDEGDFTLAIGFRARLVSGEPSADDDVEELRWVTRDEAEDLDFAWEHDRDLVRKVLDISGGA